MKTKTIAFEQVSQLSKRDIAYTNSHPDLRPFYKYEVELRYFKQVIEDKKKDNTNREVLVNVLQEQYNKRQTHPKVLQNISDLLDDNTFTVTTAHQPSLFTGPLYFIYKIISTISLSEKLRAAYPDYKFVPIFISGGEDHDFDEINHANIFNKKIIWKNEEKGAVGRMKTASLQPILAELKTILGESKNALYIFNKIENAYTDHPNYGAATAAFVDTLFQKEGLVVLNMDDARLKQLFIPLIKNEILEQPSKKIVEKTASQLDKIGFKAQAFPREINFFYLKPQLRERIVFENGLFKVLNTGYVFTEAEMQAEIEMHPERFSPNVITRPLYQEWILPNLAYIGGGGEIAYWLERKAQFEHFGINFPMLIRRNSVLWIDKGVLKKLKKLGLCPLDFFQNINIINKKYINNNTAIKLEFEEEKSLLDKAFENIAIKAKAVDQSLVKTVLAEHAKQIKTLEQLENRLLRAEKQKHDTVLKQIAGLKEKLFPKNGLQERHDNLLPLYLKYGDDYFSILKQHLDPLIKEFVVVLDD